MFKKMTLARWIIVLSVLVSIGTAWFGLQLREKRMVLQDALDSGEVESLSQGLLIKALQHSQLYREYENTGTGPQDQLQSYIAKRAARDTVALGNVGFVPKNDKIKGAIDKKIRIEPQNDRGVERTQIANFLFFLEQDSRRLYVTSLQLEPEQKRLKEHEVPDDRWLWEAEITVRQKLDSE